MIIERKKICMKIDLNHIEEFINSENYADNVFFSEYTIKNYNFVLFYIYACNIITVSK